MVAESSVASCTIPCNLCEGRDVDTLSQKSRSGKHLRTVICRACGLVWSDPRPHDARQFYEHDYRISYKNTYQPKPKHVLRAGNVALSRFEKIQGLLSNQKTMLDVGTGGGEFAYLLQSLGHHVKGVEPNRGYAEFSQQEYGLHVQIGFVQDAVFTPESFDVITIWHVLEHTEDPGSVLGRLQSWLKPDGILVVEVPNVEATCQAPQSTFHEAHLYNFNVVALRRLGRKQGLHERWHVISRDGGNITMFFSRRDLSVDPPYEATIPENYEWVSRIVRGHRPLRHYLTPLPYIRPLQRLWRSLQEQRKTAGTMNGRLLLDALYASQVQARVPDDLKLMSAVPPR